MAARDGGTVIRVLVADDHALVREGLCALLRAAGSVEVVGEAADGAAALALARDLLPAVALLDMRMPRLDGATVAAALADEGSPVACMLLTTFDEDGALVRAVAAGARAFLLKGVEPATLLAAVRTVAAGGDWGFDGSNERLRRALRVGRDGGDAAPVEALTPRETQVLRLLSAGLDNRRIAAALRLSGGTVKNHVSVILAKLGARDRTHAVLSAMRDGVI